MAGLDYFSETSDAPKPSLDYFSDTDPNQRIVESTIPNDVTAVQQDDPNSLIQRFMSKGGVVSGMGTASALTQSVGSLPTDPKARVEYYARQRFPNLPIEQAMQRYGVQDGRIFFIDDSGEGHFEESESYMPSSISGIPEAAAEAGRAVANSAGPAFPVAGGTAAGVLTAGAGGGVPGAMAGGAAGDVVRQGLASLLTGEEKSIIDRVMQTGGAALQEGAGQAIGVGIAKAAGFMGRTPVYDIPQADDLAKASGRMDIPLTAGEQTGAKSLIRRQKILANTTEGEDIFEGFYRMRNEKTRAAVYRLLDALSPEQSVRGAAKAGVEGAQSAVGVERKALQRAARPFYEEAEKVTNVNTQPVIDLIDDKLQRVAPPVAAKLRRLKSSMTTEAGPEGQLAKLDEIKKWLDDEISAAGKKGSSIGTAQRRHLEDVRASLIGQADEASEAYAKARGIYEAGMPSAAKVEKGIVGDVAKLEQNDVLRATRLLFSPTSSSAHDIRIARLAFNKAGKQAEWNALVRAHVQDALESIPESAFGNPVNLGGTLFKSLYGSPKKVGMLREALEGAPGTLKDVEYLMQVLQATGRAAKGESITAFAQAGQRELARESKPFLASALETVEVWRTPSRVARFWADVSENRYARRMSEILTSADGIKKLRELRTLSPSSKGAIIGFTHLLTAGGVAQAEDVVIPDVRPGSFGGQGSQPRP